MTTIGYLFILAALMLIRALTKGRSISQIPGDFTDALDALITGNQAALGEVLKRTGDTQDPATTDVASPSGPPELVTATGGGSGLLAEMHRLAAIAHNKYSTPLNSTGPNSYDCSGLVWRAMTNLKFITGPRFTTITFPLQARSFIVKLNSVQPPKVGDVVWWRNHMGVVDGADSFYSALSTRSGIRSLPISSMGGGAPVYYRLNTDLTTVTPPTASGPHVTVTGVSPANR